MLKRIWLQENIEDAKAFIDRYASLYPKAIETLKEGPEDSLQFYRYRQIDKAHIGSTNALERIDKKARRRSRVVSIFPSKASYLRLPTGYLMEYTEDWGPERSYIQPKKLETVMMVYEER